MHRSHPSPTGRAAPRWRLGLAIFAAWLAIGLISSSLSFSTLQGEGMTVSWLGTVGLQLPYWLYWAVITPVIVILARRWPLNRRTWRRSLPLHLLVAAGLGLIHVAGYAAMYKAYFPWPPQEPGGPPWSSMVSSILATRWQFELLLYGGILGGVLALDYARQAEERALAAVQLESQLAHAQLATLRMQLNPHFFFNTLQSVSALVVEDPGRAQRMLALLGDLLRAVLDGPGQQQVPLSEELAILERYLEIEQARFPDRLEVRFEIEPESRSLLVPSFALQPLVENAIRYAIAPRVARGTVTVAARTQDHRLVLTVADDGPGPRTGLVEGVGIRTTRARLEKLYGKEQSFSLVSAPGGGAVATIELPARQPDDG
jgi:two-component system, LytTR family, sensor kinase